MSSIEKVSFNLSSSLGKRLDKTQEEIEVLNYGIFIIIHTSISIIATILVGIITGMSLEIITIAFTGALFKRYSGGIHASTPTNCTLIGVLLAMILAMICKYISNIISTNELILLMSVLIPICNLILYQKCPVPSKNKPFKSEKSRQKIRKRAFKLARVFLYFILALLVVYIKIDLSVIKTLIIGLLFGMSLQMFAITKVGTKFIQVLDAVLNKIS